MKTQDILNSKGAKVWCIREDQSIFDALEVLVQHKIGALVVLDKNESVIGIISERDVVRVCYQDRKGFDVLPVSKVMTRVVVSAHLNDPIEQLMVLMTRNRVRHLPIIENKKLVGLVSIGDVVKANFQETAENNKQLMEYLFSQ